MPCVHLNSGPASKHVETTAVDGTGSFKGSPLAISSMVATSSWPYDYQRTIAQKFTERGGKTESEVKSFFSELMWSHYQPRLENLVRWESLSFAPPSFISGVIVTMPWCQGRSLDSTDWLCACVFAVHQAQWKASQTFKYWIGEMWMWHKAMAGWINVHSIVQTHPRFGGMESYFNCHGKWPNRLRPTSLL